MFPLLQLLLHQVRAAKEKNICLNIGIGNQRPVKTETNRRTSTDEFVLVDEDIGCQVAGGGGVVRVGGVVGVGEYYKECK